MTGAILVLIVLPLAIITCSLLIFRFSGKKGGDE